MWETRPVEMVVDLPQELAEDVERLQREDPDYLRRVIRYGLTRRMIYRSLRGMSPPAPDAGDGPRPYREGASG